MSRQVLTVSQVNRYVKRLLDSDALLAGVFIEGEISNFKLHTSGHCYFTLKDESAAISAALFSSHAENLKFAPKNGMKIIAFGRLGLYEKTGSYQLYAEHLEPAGIGGLQLAFAQMCEKLKAEGLFDEARKQKIPRFAECIAIVTSPTGAAVQDIIRTIRTRNKAVKIVLSPAKVQGEGAAQDIARALSEINAWGGADVIILGRGGGGIEDLWAFNEEITARAVAKSKTPIVSAVGHETDFTVCDFAADYRAATPTAAAQICAYDQSMEIARLLQARQEMRLNMEDVFRCAHLDTTGLADVIARTAAIKFNNEKTRLAHAKQVLEKVSPYAAFKRGFALVQKEKNLVTSAKTLCPGDTLTLQWHDGTAEVKVL